jgi:hypothetical protein
MRSSRIAARVSITGAFAVGLGFGSPALAVMSPAENYAYAEEFFAYLEGTGFIPTAPITSLEGGEYYHRCYENGECFGVSLTSQDGYVYRKSIDRRWERLDLLEQLLPVRSPLPVRRLGKINGDLADNLSYKTKTAVKEELGEAYRKTPLKLGDKKWTAQDRSRIRRAFKAGVPVAIIDATPEEVARLRKQAGAKGAAALPDGVRALEAYGIDRDTEGNLYELMIFSPVTASKAIVAVSSGNESTGTVWRTHEEESAFADSEATQSIRTRELVEWLEDDKARDRLASSRIAEAQAALAGDDKDKFKNLEEVVQSTETRMVFEFRNNIHALTTNVWSVHNATVNEDWFYVRQRGTFSAANELLPLARVNNRTSEEGDDRGRFTDLYNINTYVTGFGGNPAVFLEQSSPITTSGVAKITSNVTWNLNGKLSGNAKCGSDGKCEAGGGAEIGGGVMVSSSYSYDIPDVTVRNQSGTALNNANWDFAIASPHWKDGFGCLGFWGLGPLAPVSGATFQPVTQWIWRVGPEVRASVPAGLPITVDFRTRVRHIYFGPACNWNMTNWSQESGTLAGSMVVPWPAKK